MRSLVTLSIPAFASTLVLSASPTSDGASLRLPRSICETEYYDDPFYGDTWYYTCPFVEFNTFPKTEVVDIWVYVYDAHSNRQNTATAYWQSLNGNTILDGTADVSGVSTVDDVILAPLPDEWDNSAGVAYVEVDVAGTDEFWGVYIDDD